MDAEKEKALAEDASAAESSILEVSTNNPDDTLNYQTADEENSSKYFSMITDSTLEEPSSTDVTLESKSVINDSISEKDQIINNLSNISSKSVDKLQIHEKIDAAKILSGGIDIFEDNENSGDGHGLVIDYDAQATDAPENNAPAQIDSCKKDETNCILIQSVSNVASKCDTKDQAETKNDTCSEIRVEEQSVKSEGEKESKSMQEEPVASDSKGFKEAVVEQEVEKADNYSALLQSTLPEGSSEVTLLIDDKNVEAIDIGEGVFIYKNDDGDLTAIQITVNDDGTTSFKCLHVGKNEDGNLEVYEEQVSQVPVTNEELQSMNSQELQNPSKSQQISDSIDSSTSVDQESKKDVLSVASTESNVSRKDLEMSSQHSTCTSDSDSIKMSAEKTLDATLAVVPKNVDLEPTALSKASKEDKSALDVTEVKDKTSLSGSVSLVETRVKSSIEESILPSSAQSEESDEGPLLLNKTKTSEISKDMDVITIRDIELQAKDLSSSKVVPGAEKSDSNDAVFGNETSKSFLHQDAVAIVSPVHLTGVSTKVSDPVLPAEIISDSQDSTSNILSVINNEESSNTVESVVSSCPSITPTDSIMSEQLSINDTSKVLSFELSNLGFKEESTKSASLSGVVSQEESNSKSASEEDHSNDSNSPLIIEDNSVSQDSAMETSVDEKENVTDSIDLSTTDLITTTTEANKINLEKGGLTLKADDKSIDESAESQTSIESDDDDYVVGEPVTGDSEVEWNSRIEENSETDNSTLTENVSNKLPSDNETSALTSIVTEIVQEEEEIQVVNDGGVNVSDNNNDVPKSTLPEKEKVDENKEMNSMIIKEIDFDKFVRRNSLQMFEECVQVDYEDVVETVRTKSVPVLELEHKSNELESAAESVHVATCKTPDTAVKAHQTSPVVTSDGDPHLSNVNDVSPTPVKHFNPHKPSYSPVENNKYMSTSSYSVHPSQVPKHYLINKVSPTASAPQTLTKQDVANMKPRTYVPIHKPVPHTVSPQLQTIEKSSSFSVLNEKQSTTVFVTTTSQSIVSETTSVLSVSSEKQSPTLLITTTNEQSVSQTIPVSSVPSDKQSPTTVSTTNQQVVSEPSPIAPASSDEDLVLNLKQCSTETQVENVTTGSPTNAKSETDVSDAQRIKSRQPRKQVFTPVTRSDMEIIFPNLYNNAQEYKKESDAKSLKLKKEQDLKFKQLSRKEQSKRAEKNKAPTKPTERITSPVKNVDNNVARDLSSLSTPVKSYDMAMMKNPSTPTSPVKISDKPLLKDSYSSSPSNKMLKDTYQQPSPNKSLPDTSYTNVSHLSSPVKSYNALNFKDSHKVMSPVKSPDVREQFIHKPIPVKNSEHTTIKESPHLVSPARSLHHETAKMRTVDNKQHSIDLPAVNVETKVVFPNKYSNHHDVDNSRLKEYASPRTYSRFLNKLPVQNIYQAAEPPRPEPKQSEGIPKLTEVVEAKKVVLSGIKGDSYTKVKSNKEQSLFKSVETSPTAKENAKTEVNVDQRKTEISPRANTENVRAEKSSNVNAPPLLASDSPKAAENRKTESLNDKKFEPTSHLSNKDETEKVDKPKSSPVVVKSQLSNKDSKQSDVIKESKNESGISTPVKDSKSEGETPVTDSAKRKRGRPRKVVSDSPVVVKPKEVQSSVVKAQETPRRKLTPKDSPKIEEKSRASSISPFGKIDENIKCPICYKTFRTHNVLLKHVKHCNGTLDVDTLKTPKKRKITDFSKLDQSVEDEKSDDEVESEKDLQDEVKSNKTPKKGVEPHVIKSKLDSPTESIQAVDNVKSKVDTEASVSDSTPTSTQSTMETITLDDSIVADGELSKTVDKSPKDTQKKKVDISSNMDNVDNTKKNKAPVGRPPKNKKVEETKPIINKQTSSVASPMTRLAKIINTKPPSISPIACTVCGKTFRQLVHMVYHRSNKHNVEETDVPSDSNNVDVVVKSKPEAVETSVVKSKPEAVETSVVKSKPEAVETSVVKSKPEAVETSVEADAILKCEVCHKGFRKLHHLVEHREVHVSTEAKSRRTSVASVKSEPETGFRCDTCDKSFRKLHHLVEHREMHLAEVTEPEVPTTPSKVAEVKTEVKPVEDATCPGCGKTFRKRHHMVEHRDVHCSPSKKGKLDDGLSTESNIRLSIASSNSDEGNNCGICGKSYRKLHHMVEHRESHSEVREEKAKGKINAEPDHLNTKDIIHECSRCYMVFPNENSLNKHVDICSKKRFIKKSFNFNAQEDREIIDLDAEPVEEQQIETPTVKVVEDQLNLIEVETDQNKTAVEPSQSLIISSVEGQANSEPSPSPLDEKDTQTVPSGSETKVHQTRKLSDSKDSVKSQKSEGKSFTTKTLPVKKSQGVRKSTLTKDTISSKSRKSLILKSSSSDDISVTSRSSSVRKSSISSESISSRISTKRKSSSSTENLPIKKLITKDGSVSKTFAQRKSLDSVSKMITKIPTRRSLQHDNIEDKDENVKYKFNHNNESDVKYKINPEFSKSIKRLSQSSADVKPTTKTAVIKTKMRKSESALSGLKLPKEKVLQTIMEETNVRYSFPKGLKAKSAECLEEAATAQPVAKRSDVVKQPTVTGRRVVITKKTNIVVANKRKSLGGRKSIESRKLPGIVKKLQLRCCSQVFSSQANLAVHRKTHKDSQKVHKCDCGQVFDTEGLLKRHMDIEHTPPKSYKCTLCGASVRTAVQFAKHKRDHETEQKSHKTLAGKKLIEAKKAVDNKQTKGVGKSASVTNVSKSEKVQAGKSKSPATETRKGVKRKIPHGGVPLSDKMKKAMAGAKF